MKIPKQAQPIADYIKKTVPKPGRLPKPYLDGVTDLRWSGCRCPMGLLKEAITDTPERRHHFNRPPVDFTEKSIGCFWRWWDRQTDPKAAMDAIWGTA